MQSAIQDVMGRPFHNPPPSQEAPWGSWNWNDVPDPNEAQDLNDTGEKKPEETENPVEVQGVPAEEDADDGDDLVSAEPGEAEATRADEVYAASYQSEDEAATDD